MTEGAALSRIQLHKELWTKFDANHDELLSADDYDGKDDYFAMDMYSQVEEYYLSGLGLYQDHLLALAKGATAAPSTTLAADAFVPSELDRAKLPPVVLPSFSGDIQEWVRFKDIFTEMVLKRANLPPVYKMHYLRTALTGEAANLLEEIPPSGDHFDEAWSTLKDFYNNTRLLATRLLSKLLALEPMTASSAHEVNRIR